MQESTNSSTIGKFTVSNPYKGEQSRWYEFVKEFSGFLLKNKISDITDYDGINMSIVKLKPPVMDAAKKQCIFENNKYNKAVEKEEKLIEKLSGDHMFALATLTDCVESNLLISIQTVINEKIQNIPNPNNIEALKRFRATFTALREKCLPDIGIAIDKSKNKFQRLSSKASLEAIDEAIKIHEHELSLLPVIDANGNQVKDANGEKLFHQLDHLFMHTRLCQLLRDPDNPAKYNIFFVYMGLGGLLTFDRLYAIVKRHLKNAALQIQDDQQQVITTNNKNASSVINNNISSTPTPVTANLSNTNNYNNRPKFCANCKRTDHFTNQCNDTYCHSCKVNFPSVAARVEHVPRAHHNNNNNNNNRQLQHRGSDINNRSHYSDRNARDNNNRSSRSRSRDNSSSRYDQRSNNINDRRRNSRSNSHDRSNGRNTNNDRQRSKSPSNYYSSNRRNSSSNEYNNNSSGRVQFSNNNRSYGNNVNYLLEDNN